MSATHPYLALSIFGGSALIAAAIVFAVILNINTHNNDSAAQPAPSPATTAVAPLDGERLAVAPPSAVPVLTASVRQRGHDNARRALASNHQRIVAACWEPLRTQPGPASVAFLINFSFAADGSLIGWGLSDDEEVNRPEVSACVRGLAMTDIRIPAPGAPLGVELPLTLP